MFKKPAKNDTSNFFVGLFFRCSKLRRFELLIPFYPASKAVTRQKTAAN